MATAIPTHQRLALAAALLLPLGCADVGPFSAASTEATNNADAGRLDGDAEVPDDVPTTPTSLGQFEGYPAYLNVDETHLYWAHQTGLARLPRAGTGPVENNDLGGNVAYGVALRDGEAVVLTPQGALQSIDVNAFAQSPRQLGNVTQDAYAIAVSQDYIFATLPKVNDDSLQGKVLRVGRVGGAAQTLYSEQIYAFAVRVNNDFLYWGTYQELHRANLQNLEGRQTLAFDQGHILAISAFGDRVCWISQLGEDAESLWCNQEGSNTRIQDRIGMAMWDLEVTGNSIFWASRKSETTDDELWRYDFNTGLVDLVATATIIADLAYKDGILYWFEVEQSGHGELMRVRLE